MVMGAISNGGGSGTGVGLPGPQGPAGPPGPQGPVGLSLPVDFHQTALSVFSRAVLPPGGIYPIGQWTRLDFNVPEMDSRQAIRPGPAWQWVAPLDGYYNLLASLVMEPIAGGPGPFELRVLRMGQEEAHRDCSTQMAQIAWLGWLKAGETLSVDIKPIGPQPASIYGGPPRTSIVIAGVGVMA